MASLLSIGGSPKLEHKDKEKEVVGTISSSSTSSSLGSTSTTTPTALVETSPYHHDKYHHDKSPSQSRSQPHSQSQSPSNSHSHSNSQSHSQSPESYHSHKTPKPYQRPPQLTTSLSSTSSLYLLDKDLPPTPPSTSPTTSDSPTKASGVGGSKLLLQRGLSKLRGKSDSVGFQVISATSTKKWGNSGGRKSEESHRVLGMSLMGGRKSEDVLGREIGAGLEQGRKSEDLLRRDLSGEEEGRNEHTDRLLVGLLRLLSVLKWGLTPWETDAGGSKAGGNTDCGTFFSSRYSHSASPTTNSFSSAPTTTIILFLDSYNHKLISGKRNFVYNLTLGRKFSFTNFTTFLNQFPKSSSSENC